MFCEAYKRSLTDAAVGKELAPMLRQHLASCISCRAAFDDELALYAALDSGLRAIANSEVPATLIPRVHVALNSEPMLRYRHKIWYLTGAAAVAVASLALVLVPIRRTTVPGRTKTAPAGADVKSGSALPVALNHSEPRVVIPKQRETPATLIASRSSKSGAPEVIVAPEEQAALLRYEAALRDGIKAKSQPMIAKTVELPQGILPLEITELQLGDLKIPALGKSESDGETK